MEQLNLPRFDFKIMQKGDRSVIFDEVRRKYIALTPEEWVRQNFVRYLSEYKEFPASLMAVEKSMKVNGLTWRADIIVYDRTAVPKLIVECKAPSVSLTNTVFEQVARYNLPLKVNYLIVTNGLVHYCALLDHVHGSYQFLTEIPTFNLL
jgi:hypothetical protein